MFALYLHWPFCLSKCPYCDFNSRPIQKSFSEDGWLAAYKKELDFYAQKTGSRELSSIYFGGGTPSLMSPQMAGDLLCHISKNWKTSSDCEITLEANPTSSNKEKFQNFKKAGINRLSLGVQSLREERLKFLGRLHSAEEARQAIKAGLEVFDRFTFDLIYAVARQTEKEWREELSEALSFGSHHLSLYQLMIEEGAAFYKRARKEELQAEEEVSANLYDLTQELTEKAGLPSYEISNHAKLGQESRHNLAYWHYDDYICVGPGAHGRVCFDGKRWAIENIANPEKWKNEVLEKGQGQLAFKNVSIEEAQTEALMMGLRLREGINKKRWEKLFGMQESEIIDAQKKKKLKEEGLLDESGDSIHLTKKGHRKINAVLGYLI